MNNNEPKTASLTELKAYAFDCINQINQLQDQLTRLHNDINRIKKAQHDAFMKTQTETKSHLDIKPNVTENKA